MEPKNEAKSERVREMERVPWGLTKIEKIFLAIQGVLVAWFTIWMWTGLYWDGTYILGVPKNILASWAFGIVASIITVIFAILEYKDMRSRMKGGS